MLSTSEIPGFPKALYLKNGLRYEIDFLHVSNKSVWLGVTYLDVTQIFSKLKLRNLFKRQT